MYSVPEGWKLVPIEPTVEMWDKAESAMILARPSEAEDFPTHRIGLWVLGYRAAMKAAPEHQMVVRHARQLERENAALRGKNDILFAAIRAIASKEGPLERDAYLLRTRACDALSEITRMKPPPAQGTV